MTSLAPLLEAFFSDRLLRVGLLRDGTPPLQKHSPRASASA
jgi:hypothetical protein